MASMLSLDRAWDWLKKGKGVYKATVWALVVLPTAAFTVMTYITAVAAQIPLPYLITATVVTFAASLVLINQVRMLFGVPVVVAREPEYAYGMGYGGLYLAADESNTEAFLQLGVNLSNCSGLPMAFRVVRIHVSLADRIIPSPSFDNTGGLLSPGITNVFKHAAFPKASLSEFIGKRTRGELEIQVMYGHPEKPPARTLVVKTALWLNLAEGKFTVVENTLTHLDIPVS